VLPDPRSPEDPDRPSASPTDPPVQPGAWPGGFARGPEDREALLRMAHVEGVTPREVHTLATRLGSAQACLDALLRGRIGSSGDRDRVLGADPAGVRRALAACGARLVAPGDEEYPRGLADLVDPPAWLFVRGSARLDRLAERAAAIVGARNCSPYGREMAEELGAGLAAAGVTVVSGAARGVDVAAHRGALRVSGPTVAVLGSGIDVPYPAAHRHLLDEIADAGAVISEYPPGMPARPRRFPARNRLVAALASVVVVVEGAAGSGSLITAEFAQDLDRDLGGVPGPVTSELSTAPHALIRDGAGLVRNADDVLDALGMLRADVGGSASAQWRTRDSQRDGGPELPEAEASVEALTETEGLVVAALTGAPQVVDQVAAGASLDAPTTLRALMALELRGAVLEEGGRYRRALSDAALRAWRR
jgi:DNA processing protein